MRRHGPVITHCTDSEDFPNRPNVQSTLSGIPLDIVCYIEHLKYIFYSNPPVFVVLRSALFLYMHQSHFIGSATGNCSINCWIVALKALRLQLWHTGIPIIKCVCAGVTYRRTVFTWKWHSTKRHSVTSGGASAAKEPGHFEARTSLSQVTRMHFFPRKS